jgi:murein DD-endopeptidase MepM/ murein hydrolase activator NlpD
MLGLTLLLLLIVPLALPAQQVDAQSCGPGVTHLVQRGDNLYRISIRYGTSMAAIANANGISDYSRIYAGQSLTIPCGGGGAPAPAPGGYDDPEEDGGILPGVFVTPSVQLDPIVVNCRRLRPSSPRDGLAPSLNTFYWDPARGNPTGYRVNVYNEDLTPGRLVASFDVPGTRTSVSGDIGQMVAGGGYLFSWEVQALVSDIPVCTSERVTMFRDTGLPARDSDDEEDDDDDNTPVPTAIPFP